MPIEWTAIADLRRVEAVASGTVTATKLFDMSHALLDIRASEMRTIAGLINARADEGGERLGAVAFVVDSANALDVSMLYDERTVTASRPIAIFASRELAIEWLDRAASSGGRD